MMDKQIIWILILLKVTESLTVSNNICSCSSLQTAFDCNQLSQCEWDLSSKACIGARQIAYYSLLCTSLRNGIKCAQQRGCAFLNKKCVIFSNCQSYIATSNLECQRYSMQCNWSLLNNYCTEENVCSEYNGEDKQSGCESIRQLNGESSCLFNTQTKQCKQKECKDYFKNTNEDCKEVLLNQNCITDKKTCVKELNTCDSYTIEDCLNVLTKNGECEINNNTHKCQPRTCGLAPDASSDDACKKYKSTCLSNKMKCVDQLSLCSTYSIDECLILKGQKGDCQLNSESSQCKDPSCDNFQGSTNDECKKASPDLNCISNGVQCVSSLADTCTKVKILENTTCDQYISKEGQCKSQSEESKTCILDQCQNKQYDSDEQCNKYSSKDTNMSRICVSNGVICTTQLLSCNSYKKSDGCFKYKGQDGKCIDNDSSENCQATPCEQILQPSLSTCQTTNPNCNFDGQSCVATLRSCDYYTSKCDTIITSNKQPCIEDPNNPEKCIEKTCNTAPTSIKTDEECDQYLTKCLTNGQGCTDKLSTCDTYSGTFQQCDKLIGSDGKCTGISKSQTNEKCKVKNCQESSTANEQACKAYTKNCLYNSRIHQCQNAVEQCKSIDNQITCEQTLSNEPGRFCMWIDNSCVQATCNMIETQGSQEVCETFGQSCEFDNISGCKDKSFHLCSSFRSRTLCITDSSGNACIWDQILKKCIKFNQCEDFSFSIKKDELGNPIPKTEIEIAKENLICSSISDKCFSDGSQTCKHKLPCPKFTQAICNQKVGIDDKQCGYNPIKQACQTFISCNDLKLKNHLECQAYNIKCTTNKETCVEKIECDMIKEQDSCEAGGYNGRCFWNNSTCTLWKCENAILTTHQACQKESLNCTSNGVNCIALQDCNKYTKESCEIGLNNSICFYDNNKNQCRIKICTDYTDITEQSICQVKGCAYDSTKSVCINFESCNNYINQPSCNDNVSKQNQTCIWQEQINQTSTCLEMNSCSQANLLEKNCKDFGCIFVPQTFVNGTLQQSQCNYMDCSSLNLNSNSYIGCKPVINKSANTITLCTWSSKEKKCIESTDLNGFNQNTCFIMTQYNYYWNPIISQCVSCTQIDRPTNSSKSNDTPNASTNAPQNSFGINIFQNLAILIVLCIQLI